MAMVVEDQRADGHLERVESEEVRRELQPIVHLSLHLSQLHSGEDGER